MVCLKPINLLAFLALLSYANSQFAPLADWLLRKDSGATISEFANLIGGGTPVITPSSAITANSATGCQSIAHGEGAWSLSTDYSTLISGSTEFAVGFWVEFIQTTSAKVFQFGDDSGAHYVVSSTADGTLKVVFYSDSTTTDTKNDFTFTVPLSNSYTDKFFFLVFDFVDNSGTVTLNILLPGTAKISQTSKAGAAATFALPDGHLYFFQNVVGRISEVVLTKTASINGLFDTITLNDGSTSQDYAKPCAAGTCSDAACTSDGKCLTSKHYCTTCSGSTCSTCDPDSSRDENDYCNSCKGSTSLLDYHCNSYLGCATANNCAGCSQKSTVCDVCAAGNFLYDESATSTICLCNFYLACTDSCSLCKPGPECYNCATAITQDGNTCREDSVGFQVSVDIPNIIMDFAHPLSTGLTKSSFQATSNAGSNILTGGWTFTGCDAGSVQCIIGASNVLENQLPIELDFEFTQVASASGGGMPIG